MNRFLVGLDGSPRTASVLATAVALARKTGAKVILFRAVGLPPELPPAVWRLDQPSLVELLRKNAERDLAECAQKVPPELLEGTRVEIGVPWQAICGAATDAKADLVVIGSHGYGTLDRLLGTTAAKVVNHADRCVLVVRGDVAV